MNRKTKKPNNNENCPSAIIDGILGKGLTCIGSRNPLYRYILQEQMARAVATGKPFLDHFETIQSPVLVFRNGSADYHQTFKRLKGGLDNLLVRENKSYLRIKASVKPEATHSLGGYHKDILSYMKTAKQEHCVTVFIIPDFNDIRMSYKDYLENEFKGCNADYSEESLKSPKLQNIDYHREIEGVKHLRNFAANENISIITGHDIGTRKNFSYSNGPMYADNKMYLIEDSNGWTLKIKDSVYVPTSNYKLEYNYHSGFLIAEEEKDRMTDLPLLDHEKQIIDLLIKHGPMRFTEIKNNTGLKSGKLDQRLKALQKENKGCWISQNNGAYEAIRQDCFWHND